MLMQNDVGHQEYRVIIMTTQGEGFWRSWCTIPLDIAQVVDNNDGSCRIPGIQSDLGMFIPTLEDGRTSRQL
jgi:hypothetical protein